MPILSWGIFLAIKIGKKLNGDGKKDIIWYYKSKVEMTIWFLNSAIFKTPSRRNGFLIGRD